jgi:hypothetical protein
MDKYTFRRDPLVIQNRDGGDTLEAFLRELGGVFNQLLPYEVAPNGPADAEKIIKYQLNSGWLYEVDGELRIIDPEAYWPTSA